MTPRIILLGVKNYSTYHEYVVPKSIPMTVPMSTGFSAMMSPDDNITVNINFEMYFILLWLEIICVLKNSFNFQITIFFFKMVVDK